MAYEDLVIQENAQSAGPGPAQTYGQPVGQRGPSSSIGSSFQQFFAPRQVPNSPDSSIAQQLLDQIGTTDRQDEASFQDLYDVGVGEGGSAGRAGNLLLDDSYADPDTRNQAYDEQYAQNQQDALFGIGAPYLPTGEASRQIESLRSDEDLGREALNAQVQQGEADARQRAKILESQLRDAGMLQLADQFRRAQRGIAFDTARRGTLGGSRSIERAQEAELARQSGASQVALGAQQAGQQLFQQETAPLYQLQQQAQASPFSQLGTNLALQDVQSRGQGAGGTFNLEQQRTAADQQADATQGAILGGTLSAIGGGVTAGVQSN